MTGKGKYDGEPRTVKTSRNGTVVQQRRIRNRNRGIGSVAEWDSCDSKLVLRVITAVTRRGGAVQFGYTKDGSSYVVRILGDGEPYNEFVRSTEDIALYLEGLAEDFESPGE